MITSIKMKDEEVVGINISPSKMKNIGKIWLG